MTLQLSAEVEALVRRIAEKTGRAPEDVVRESVRSAALAAGVAGAGLAGAVDMRRAEAIIARVASMPLLDARTADEIIGYDEFGLPR